MQAPVLSVASWLQTGASPQDLSAQRGDIARPAVALEDVGQDSQRDAGQNYQIDLPDDLANPARRALLQAGLRRLDQVSAQREADLRKLHGIGPKAIEQLRRSLEARGKTFRRS